MGDGIIRWEVDDGQVGQLRGDSGPLVTVFAFLELTLDVEHLDAFGFRFQPLPLPGRISPLRVLSCLPIFLLIMLVGAVFGSSMGFQMGALTLLFSAFLTGGIGPWLPFQMLVAGWVGLTAGWLPRSSSPRWRVAILAAFGAVWGLVFGVLMNLWFWPFSAPGADAESSLYWVPESGALDRLERYARFYLVTSLGFDLFRAAGNVVLVLLLGGPILRLLERYRQRLSWQPWTEVQTD